MFLRRSGWTSVFFFSTVPFSRLPHFENYVAIDTSDATENVYDANLGYAILLGGFRTIPVHLRFDDVTILVLGKPFVLADTKWWHRDVWTMEEPDIGL